MRPAADPDCADAARRLNLPPPADYEVAVKKIRLVWPRQRKPAKGFGVHQHHENVTGETRTTHTTALSTWSHPLLLFGGAARVT